MSGTLGGLPPDARVTVVCAPCRRRGCYRVAGLVARLGPDLCALDTLRTLTASCRHQDAAGAGKRRRYVPTCLAAIGWPARAGRGEPPTPGGTPYTIETWARDRRGIELHLATLYRADMADAAYAVACALWPDTEITVRQGARVLHHNNRPHRDLLGGA